MRSTSLEFIQAAFAQETGEGIIVLVTITHSTLVTPIRVARWDVDVVSRTNTFVAYPFELSLPSDLDESAPRAQITIDNVDQEIVRAVRNAGQASPIVLLEVVRSSDPDTVEVTLPDFELSNVTYDALTVEGELTLDILTGEPYPAGRFRPGAFPGIF